MNFDLDNLYQKIIHEINQNPEVWTFYGIISLSLTFLVAYKILKKIPKNKKTPPSPKNWLSQIPSGLSKTRSFFHTSLSEIFSDGRQLDKETLNKIHETLYRSDMGIKTVNKLVRQLQDSHSNEQPNLADIKETLRTKSLEILKKADQGDLSFAASPYIILIVGVNGVGKTSTIGKLAAHYLARNKSVMLAASDTYRAAAIDQLKSWGDKLNVKVISHKHGSDPAAVAYDSVAAATARKTDVLIIDTAGRLQSKEHLMKELAKIKKVISKDHPTAPHETLLVLDSTTGQNAFRQVEQFKEIVQITGIIVTKLDGTAKGGVVIGITDKYELPIRFIGLGEKASDLKVFNAVEFIDNIFEKSSLEKAEKN